MRDLIFSLIYFALIIFMGILAFDTPPDWFYLMLLSVAYIITLILDSFTDFIEQ